MFSLTPWSARIQTGLHLSRLTWELARPRGVFVYVPFTLSGVRFHGLRLTRCMPHCGPATPGHKCPGLGCSRFARHYSGNRCALSFPPVTEMFHFTGSGSCGPMNSIRRQPILIGLGSPIRTSTDQSVFAAPRGLSQLATSFIASCRQGIRLALLVA